MSGSSRSLIKALDSVLSKNDETEPSKEETASFNNIISQYFQKHNNLATIQQSTSISDELYELYNKYVKPSQNIDKEYKFLEVLSKVCGVFNHKESHLWVRTYLRPMIDSAGYDSRFVEEARVFLKSLVIDYGTSQDPGLLDLREKFATSVIQMLLNIYLDEDVMHSQLSMQVAPEQKDTQTYHERKRFIRYNCAQLLKSYGVAHVELYCRVLDEHIQNVDHRAEGLILFADLVGSQKPCIAKVADLPIFLSLMRCICYDFNGAIVHSALTVLLMLLPQVSTSLGAHLPDLLVMYSRILSWHEFNKFIPNRFENFHEYANDTGMWRVARETRSPSGTEVIFDYQHYATLLYGLFPFNFFEFARAPYEYFNKRAPQLMTVGFFKHLEASVSSPSFVIEDYTKSVTKSLLVTFLLHPKCLAQCHLKVEPESESESDLDLVLDEEISNPISWIESDGQKKENQSLSSEDVATACLSLNPNLLMNANSIVNYHPALELNRLDKIISRKSSMSGPIYMSTSGASKALLANNLPGRRVSIVPTNFVIDNAEGTIKFQDVNFDTNSWENGQNANQSFVSDGASVKNNTVANANANASAGASAGEPLPELLEQHEHLFSTNLKHIKRLNTHPVAHQTAAPPPDPMYKNSMHETLSPVSETRSIRFDHDGDRNDVKLSRPMSSPTTTLETVSASKEKQYSNSSFCAEMSTLNGSGLKPYYSMNDENGTSIDFYQRELLLYKNEIEFTSYMKHLNKIHYSKLRKAVASEKMDEGGRVAEEIHELEKIVDALKQDIISQGNKSKLDEQSVLLEQIRELRDANESLLEQVKGSEVAMEVERANMEKVLKEDIPNKDFEIEQLKIQVAVLEQEKARATRDNNARESEDTNHSKQNHEGQLVSSKHKQEHETQLYNMKIQLQLAHEKVHQMSREYKELEDSYNITVNEYDKKVANSKLAISNAISSYALKYEKKNQELATALVKFEKLLEEKDLKIARLSASNPIPINGAYNQFRQQSNSSITSGRTNDAYEGEDLMGYSFNPKGTLHTPAPISQMRRHSSSKGSEDAGGAPLSHSKPPPLTSPLTSDNLPILKGRGGYQKRSKKMM
ncbi:uncharacterized protein LODBEIA_P24870 [Lodderomyces beijingensis]|uniref:Tuberous sclerosis 1 n=1 Tax=Lodderomyces beijingensis TaxID=1775926 RepID=A0ABP0ZJE3_9ASCO